MNIFTRRALLTMLFMQLSTLESFQYLYAPWRTDYILNTTHKPLASTEKEACVFCARINEYQDERHYILSRHTHNFVILNKYPYNTGHLLIIPYEHVPSLDTLSLSARIELMELMTQGVTILKEVLGAGGVNVGINLGRPAGAGIPGHLHVHLVPRWEGDTGFLDTAADVKLVSVDLGVIYEQLKPFFKALE